MDYGLADYAAQMTPEQKQQLAAEMLRARVRQQAEAQLAAAHQQGHSMDNMAAVAPMMNNPGVLASAQAAQRSAQSAYKPVQMGQQGFMLPNTGEFIESPVYADEKQAARDATKENNQSRLQATMDMMKQRLEYQQQHDKDMLEFKRQQAADNSALRLTLAGMAADRQASNRDLKLGRDRDAQIQKYTAQLSKAKVPEFQEALSIAEGTLAKYKEGELPGYGRFEGFVPDRLATGEQQGVRSDMQIAANNLLKAISGSAVSVSEQDRVILRQLAMGGGMEESTIRRAFKNVRKVFDKERQNITSSIPPEVHDEIVNRGGVDYRVKPGDKYID